MSSVQTITYPSANVRPMTLNDLRLRSQGTRPTAAKSTMGLTGIVLVAALAAGAFVMFDPLGMKSGHEPKPAPLAMAPAAPSVPATASPVATPLAPPVSPALSEPATEPATVLKAEPKPAVSRAPVARATVTKHRSTTTTFESRRSESAADTGGSSPAVDNPSVSEPRDTRKPAATTPSTGPEAQVDGN